MLFLYGRTLVIRVLCRWDGFWLCRELDACAALARKGKWSRGQTGSCRWRGLHGMMVWPAVGRREGPNGCSIVGCDRVWPTGREREQGCMRGRVAQGKATKENRRKSHSWSRSVRYEGSGPPALRGLATCCRPLLGYQAASKRQKRRRGLGFGDVRRVQILRTWNDREPARNGELKGNDAILGRQK